MATQPTLQARPSLSATRNEALAELPESLDLPGLGTADGTGRTATVRCRLDPHLAGPMARLAVGAGAGTGTVFTAAVAGLLLALRAGTDLPVGTTAQGDPAQVRVLRISGGAGAALRPLVAAVRAEEEAAHAHDGVPHREVEDAVNALRGTPGRPLLRVGAAVGRPPVRPGELWFTLRTEPSPRVELTYPVAALTRTGAQNLCDRLARVLTRAVREPDTPFAELGLLLPGEAAGLIATGPDAPVHPGSPAGWFEEGVGRWGGEPAVIDGEHTYSYQELDGRADRVAWSLRARGVGAESVVAVLLPRSERAVTAFVGVLKAGGVYLPVDPELPWERVRLMLEDAGPVVVVTDAAGAGRLGGEGVELLVLDAELSGCESAPVGPPAVVTGESGAYLLYTSGSTGRPKGVLMTVRAVMNLLTWHLDELPGGPGRTTVQFTSLSFDISLQEMLSTLLSGAALAIVPEDVRRTPHAFAPWLEEHGVTDLFAPNIVIELLCRAALEQGRTLPALAHLAQAGEALVLSEAVRAFCRQRPGRRLHNHYGPTETHAVTSYVLPAAEEDWPAGAPIGRPVHNTAVYVLDEALRLVPDGVAGELYAAGPCLARGYAGRPGLTADRFLPDPYGPPGSRMYRTGDLVRRRTDGTLDYLGRTDHQVKIRGMRVELGEIEAALRATPGVRDTVLVTAGEAGQRRIDAYLVPAPDADPATLGAAVRAALRRTLPPAMVPATFTVVDRFPLNSNGKVDRHALPAPAPAGTDPAGAPRTGNEERLARIFAEVLGLPAVGIHDGFYDVGGNSLLGGDLTARLRKEFQVELTLGEVLAHPTVAELATLLERVEPARPPLAPRTGTGPAPASFAQQSLWVLDQLEGPGPGYNEPVALRLTGPLDVAALRQALADVADRHHVLRTVLRMEDGQIVQRVREGADAVPALERVSVAPADLAAAVRAAARVPFDLGADLPVRATLFALAEALGEEEHLLLVVTHHAACDGVSLLPLLRDLTAAYDARTAGRAPDWAPLPVQYADYAVWQRDLFAAADAEPSGGLIRRQYRFWEERLAGLPDAMPLPLDRPRPPVRSGDGAGVPFAVDADTHRALRDLARTHRTTGFTVVHAALAALLSDRGAGEDVVVAAVVSDRGEPALEDLVGFFVRTLVLRTDTAGAPDFAALLDRVREADLAAFAHPDLPFEYVVELVNPARSLAYHPLAQVMLAFQVQDVEPPRPAGLTARFEPVETGVAKFDLCFKVVEHFAPGGAPAGITGVLEYATDVFDAVTARDLAEGLVAYLAKAAS
ncbi:amino acid adenylation domain-containing protein [Streptomyces sp. NPDC006326]|uniref:amino acid adenylation domain-containing protein n=1 Tax=Streptomyces sp. NPDC006326 TaxID=3156752 RepID=UPI0033AAAA9B